MRRLQFCLLAVSLTVATLPVTAQVLNATPTQITNCNRVVPATGAQTAVVQTNAQAAQVPQLVKFGATLKGVPSDGVSNGIVLAPGAAPTSVVAITFSLYAEQSGGAPLWSEVQNVRVDTSGHYTVQLGASKPDGLPLDLFATAQAQWLGVQVQGQAERPRVMLVSVPYALKAANAETFGGKPPSAYMQTTGADGSSRGGVGLAQKVKNDHPLGLSGSGTTNYVPLWTNASTLTSSVIYQGLGDEIGIGTSDPLSTLEVHGNNSISIVDATQTGSSGPAVSGEITATSGSKAGVVEITHSAQGSGVQGENESTTGLAVGTYGGSASSTGVGVRGVGFSTTGVNFGTSGSTSSPSGVGVIGENLQTTGEGFGVVGNSDSSSGTGVLGNAASTTGNVSGVKGVTSSSDGIGVQGEASSTSETLTAWWGPRVVQKDLAFMAAPPAAQASPLAYTGTVIVHREWVLWGTQLLRRDPPLV